MKTTLACTAVLLAATLTGCIMLPPPPPRFAHRGPPPEAADACAGQAEGARFEMPGRRGDILAGTCERGPDGRLTLRPDGPR